MKLYEILRGSKIYGLKNYLDQDVVVTFFRLDGAYSYCTLENEPEKVVHLSANTNLEKYKDGYKVL